MGHSRHPQTLIHYHHNPFFKLALRLYNTEELRLLPNLIPPVSIVLKREHTLLVLQILGG